MHRYTRASWIMAALAIAGCSAAPPVPRDHFYRIDIAAPAPERTPLLEGTVTVHPFAAAGLLQERPLLFTSAGQLHEMRQHDYHFWTETPPRLLQSALAGFLRESGAVDTVVTPDLRVPARFEIVGKVKRLERIIADPVRVYAELEIAVIDLDNTRLISARTYSAEAESRDEAVDASVIALNHALGDIFNRFLGDLRNLGHRALEADTSG